MKRIVADCTSGEAVVEDIPDAEWLEHVRLLAEDTLVQAQVVARRGEAVQLLRDKAADDPVVAAVMTLLKLDG